MKYFTVLLFIQGIFLKPAAQVKVVTLDTCIQLAEINYPNAGSIAIYQQLISDKASKLSRNYWPQVQFNAQASYQSDVTSLEIDVPGLPIPEPLSKDQYKMYLDVQQWIFDGGMINSQKKLSKSSSSLELAKAEIDQYGIRQKVEQMYFACLILREQLELNQLFLKDIQQLLDRLNASFNSGVVLESDVLKVRSEQLEALKQTSSLKYELSKLYKLLHHFTKLEMAEETTFKWPIIPVLKNEITRPELRLFDLQNEVAQAQYSSNMHQSIPRVGLFGQLGYSNPALNFLKNGFEQYYIAGVRLNWNFSGLYSLSKDKSIRLLSQNLNTLQKEQFLFNLELENIRKKEELQKLTDIENLDKDLIDYRKKIKDISKSQYDQGVISLNEYLKEWHEEQRAQLSSRINKLQRVQCYYEIQNINGSHYGSK